MPISINRKTGPPTEKNDRLIAALKESGMSAPWSDEYEKMISGLRYAYTLYSLRKLPSTTNTVSEISFGQLS